MKTAKTRVLAARVNGDVYDRVIEICSKNGKNPNDFVKVAIDRCLDSYEKLVVPGVENEKKKISFDAWIGKTFFGVKE